MIGCLDVKLFDCPWYVDGIKGTQEMHDWCLINLTNGWHFGLFHAYFTTEEDAILFQLRF